MTENSQLIEKLRLLISDGDEVDRCYAIRTLQTIQDTSSTDLLISAMRDDDIDVSVDAIRALGKLGGESVAQKLVESLVNDPDGEIKLACVKALVELADDEATDELLKLAETAPEEMSFTTGDWDLWWDMQLIAIRGLGDMQLTKAVPVLTKVLADDDCLDIESEIFNSLAKIGGEAEDYLFERFAKGTPRTRRRIAKALGKSQSTSTMKPLARGLQDKNADVREATLLALQARNATQYLPAVLLTFRDANSTVRKVAVEVAHKMAMHLQQTGQQNPHLIESLLLLLQDNDYAVKASVLSSLSSLGWQADDENKAYLSDLLRESTGDCFASVCRAIDEQQITEGVATLLYMFRHKELSSDENIIHALNSLGQSKQWNSVIETILAEQIYNDKKMIRLSALEALSELDKAFPQGSKVAGLEKDARLPLDLITEALQGELSPPITQKVIPIVPVEDVAQKFDTEAQEAKSEVDEAEEDTSFVDDALQQIKQSINDGEKPHPMSTLDAIAITSVEKELEAKAEQAPAMTLEQLAENDEELQGFLALTKENKETSQWLFNKGAKDVNVDIQRLAARILGKAGTKDAFPVLIDILKNTDDGELKREAALSLGVLVEKKIELNEDLKPALHKALLAELNAENRDLRIASARALGALGNSTDISSLIEKLQDDDSAMRMQTLSSLSKIAMRSKQDEVDYHELAELMLAQLDNNDTGVHRAVVDALVPLFGNKLNGSTVVLKQAAITSLIKAGLSGTHGQVKEMSWGLKALDKELSSTCLLDKMDEVNNSLDRRYIVEMLGELHKPN